MTASMRSTLAVVVSTAITATLCALFVDQPLAMFIDRYETEWMRDFGHVFEEVGKSLWMLIATLVIGVLAWRSYRQHALRSFAIFGAIASSGIVANIIKVLVGRSRPPLLIEHGIAAWEPLRWHTEYIWNSFPSGHASTGLALAVTVSAFYPRVRWLAWTLGLCIALGRTVYNVHYLSDVIAGAALGVIAGIWFVRTEGGGRRTEGGGQRAED